MEGKQGVQKTRFQNLFHCGMAIILYERLSSYLADISDNMNFLNYMHGSYTDHKLNARWREFSRWDL